MLLSLKKTNKKKTTKNNNNNNKHQQQQQATIKQTKTATTYNSPCLHHKWRCYQAIALNDHKVGPTSLALMSP